MLFAQPLPSEVAAENEPAPAISEFLASVRQRIATWAATCADYWSAASLYDELRGLSDAELQRRGLARDTLARDVCQACDRTAGS